ncbi:hypothetical protein AAVH_29169 [Aphelenchoides avenae]|nr:hypothetical protein AAVH_29169 [Aphelenchus avenae]
MTERFVDIIADDSEKFYDECVELKRLGTTLLKSDRIKGASEDIFKTIDQYIPCEKYAFILYRFVAFQELPFPSHLPWGPGPVVTDEHSTYRPHTRDYVGTLPIGPSPNPYVLGPGPEDIVY